MLKILEEPREDILFILETHTLETLLPTIKSRCWIISFQPLSIKSVSDYLLNKFQSQLDKKIIQNILKKFDGENLSELIEELYEISSNSNENYEIEEENQINFIELFRYLYLSNFYKAITYLDEFNLLNDRQEATKFINDLLSFSYKVLKTKLSSEDKEEELIKLSNVIDPDNFNRVIEFLTKFQYYIENYVNMNLLFMKLLFLIKNSFIKK